MAWLTDLEIHISLIKIISEVTFIGRDFKLLFFALSLAGEDFTQIHILLLASISEPAIDPLVIRQSYDLHVDY